MLVAYSAVIYRESYIGEIPFPIVHPFFIEPWDILAILYIYIYIYFFYSRYVPVFAVPVKVGS